MIFDVPRITSAKRDAIGSPTTSSVIYNTDDNVFEYWDGNNWIILGPDIGAYTGEATGFPVGADGEVDRTTSSISFDAGSRTFSITSATAFIILIKGKIHRKTGTVTRTITNTEGMHYIYFDETGALTSTTTFSIDIILKYVYVASIYWDATNGAVIHFGDERHGCTMDGATHLRIHQKDGAIFVSGMALSSFSVDGNGGSDAHAQFAIGSGAIRDEDIPHSLSAVGATTAIPVLYKSSTNWRKQTTANFKVYPDPTTGRLYYNNAGALTAVANNKFVLYHIVATNDVLTPFVSIMGTSQYDTKSEARVGAVEEIKLLSGLPFVEFVFVGTVIFETNDAYTNSVKAKVVSTDTGTNYVDWRFASSGLNPTTVNLTTHNNLGGVQGGSGGNYYHSNQPINSTDDVTFDDLNLTGDANIATGKTYKINNTTVLSASQVLGKSMPTGDVVGTSDSQTLTNKTLEGFTVTGDITVTGTAIDIDLIDNNASALSFDAAGKAGILEIVTTDGGEKVKMSGDLEVSGNFTVNGTTTNINTTNLVVEDKNIILGDTTSPSDATADGGGITLKGTSDKTLNWVDSTDSWTSSEHIDLASGKVYKINNTTVLSASQVLGKTLPTGDVVGTSDSQTLSGKTIALGSNTVSGTLAEFNTALTDDNFVSLTGNETLTNKTLTSPKIASIVIASTNAVVTLPVVTNNYDIVGTDVSQTLTNKTINGSFNTISNIGNSSLTNSSITINGSSISLGGSATVRTFTNADITSNTTVVAWTQNFVFTSNGAITVTLPAAPSNGDRIRIVDADYGSAGTNITIGRNAKKIDNAADDFLIDINGAAVELVYNTTAGNWQIVNNPI